MKTRIGFVSNSSSASFIIHTDWLPKDFENILKTEGLYELVKERLGVNQLGKACLSGWVSMWNGEESLDEDLNKVIDMIVKKFGANYYMLTINSD